MIGLSDLKDMVYDDLSEKFEKFVVNMNKDNLSSLADSVNSQYFDYLTDDEVARIAEDSILKIYNP